MQATVVDGSGTVPVGGTFGSVVDEAVGCDDDVVEVVVFVGAGVDVEAGDEVVEVDASDVDVVGFVLVVTLVPEVVGLSVVDVPPPG